MTGGNGSGGSDVWGGALRVREAALRTARGGGGGADALLAALSGVVAHDHASLTRWDPLRRRHVTLASTYPDGANAYIERRLHEDAGFASVRRSPAGARWWHDVPDHERRLSPGWRGTLEPLGVRDGVAQCLFAADGRYVGMLNASATRGGRGDHGAARAAVALLGDCLAAAVDPLRPGTPGDAGPGAGERAAGVPGTVLVPDDPDAAPVPLDGERPVGFASADSPLAGAVRRAARRRPGPARLLVPYGGGCTNCGWPGARRRPPWCAVRWPGPPR
ncbi:autoinducer binding domain-containing protein [Streptomyces sp. CC210A]|uniref:autoinducer binding domain-containing protein n=1 Tax=Streptomyces sp. CC210A TaxID=2898184 RepID=UPI001F311724|nr:autoinducer binding domain-containing protein [Streptomyces sp. CC210A]